MVETYDIAVIGAGPGGYIAAIRAAQLGFKTVCIDKRATLGGTCLNVGCIPSKALLQSTEMLAHLQREGNVHGLEYSDLKVNFSTMMERKKKIVSGLVEGIAGLLKRHAITVIQGEAEFIDAHHLLIKQADREQTIEASYILIASGSESIALPDLLFDEKQIVSSTGALSLSRIPEQLLVVGGGVIGVELASVYQRLGSQVTIVEMLDHICPAMDASLSKQLLQSLKKQGIEFWLSSRVVTAVVQPEEVIVTIDQQGTLQNKSVQIVLVAVGRKPHTAGLHLERIGIQTTKQGFIPVDEMFRTAQSHIFAIGDVIEGVMLAHRASAEGTAVVEALKGQTTAVNYLSIPNVIYTYPEVASVGLTEQEALQASLSIQTGISYFRGNSRARCSGETEGFVKIIGDQISGRLLGMHIVGPHASELIAEGMLAIQKQATVEDLANAAQAHPTLSEAIKEAALDALGRPIHH